MRFALALVGLVVVVPSCTQPIRDVDTPRPDAGARDVPAADASMDAAAGDTPASDVPGMDAPGSDVRVLDAPTDVGPLDVGRDVPDDVRSDASSAASTCNDLFGSLPSYLLCAASATECRFQVQLTGPVGDCREVCETAGYTCDGVRRIGAGPCMEAGSQACGSPASPAICICRP